MASFGGGTEGEIQVNDEVENNLFESSCCRKMNEQDKERYRQEKEVYDRAVSGTAVKMSAPAGPAVGSAAGQEAGTLQCIRVGCSNASVRHVELN